jgi:RNA polymerase sigma factor (TIGR02999 family)
MSDLIQILEAVGRGDKQASEQLLPAVYDDLRRLAASMLAREAPGSSLQATALVHEAYLRLVGSASEPHWDHRGHFFMAAAQAMRRILVENARRKKTLKQGGSLQRADLELDGIEGPQPGEDLLALDEALKRLGEEDPRAAQLVDLRYFVGLTLDEAAQVLGVSIGTAKRDWTYARSWLRNELRDDPPPPE